MDENKNTQPSAAPSPAQNNAGSKPGGGFFKDFFIFIIVALVVVLPIRFFVIEPFVVDGASMSPTFATNDYLLVNQLGFDFSNPARGQVIIFRYPKNPSVFYIKRVIGLPGEEVELDGTTTTICTDPPSCNNSFVLPEPYVTVADESYNPPTSIVLGSDQYFVMGDNRIESSDSRSWGPVPRDLIVGTPLVRLYPFSEIGVMPGNFKEPTN